jgi:hypothetical protein
MPGGDGRASTGNSHRSKYVLSDFSAAFDPEVERDVHNM